MPKSVVAVSALISKWIFLVVIALVPVIALPWTLEAFETSKQLILILGASLAIIFAVPSLLSSRHNSGWPSSLTIAPLLFLMAVAVSSFTSIAPMTSWIGQGTQEYVSVLTLIGLLTMYFLAKHLFQTDRTLELGLLSLFAGGALVSLALLPVFFGVQIVGSTNLVGTPYACAIFLLTLGVLASAFWLIDFQFSTRWRQRAFVILASTVFIGCCLILLALDTSLLWMLTLLSAGLLLTLALVRAESLHKLVRLVPVMLLCLMALVFLILPTHLPSPFFQEVAPNLNTSWTVVNGAWNEGSVLFGAGPGTFALVYSKYMPLSVNDSAFWEIVFDRGNAYVTTLLAHVGIVGTLLWLLLPLVLISLTGKKLLAADAGWQVTLAVFSAWFVLGVGACVYNQNMTLSLVYWVLSGMLASTLLRDEWQQTQTSIQARLAKIFAAIFGVACAISLMLVSVPRYAAEMMFTKAAQISTLSATSSQIDTAIEHLDRAAKLSPWNDAYYRALASVVLRRLALVSADEATKSEYVQSLVKTAIATAVKATQISPANVANWDELGLVYRELLPLVPDAAQPAIDAYEQAIVLAPAHPRYRVEAAKALVIVADAQTPYLENADKAVATQAVATQSQSLARADEHVMTAIALKSDYAPAYYVLSAARERQGNLVEAVRALEYARALSPDDVGVGLKLGILYLRQGKNAQAQMELQRVLELAPAYADAHWYLSVAFEQSGDLVNAIAEVEAVLGTNPDNANVKTRLDRLKAGRISAEIPEPVNN